MHGMQDEPLFCERDAGLDIAKAGVQVIIRCVRHHGPPREQETRAFGTTRAELESLGDWLACWGVTRIGMEATGDYWKPVFFLLESRGFDCQLYNAAQVKALPGRPKTDLLTELREGLGLVGGRLGLGWLRSLIMIADGDAPRDLSRLVVPLLGSLEATGDSSSRSGWSMPTVWWLPRLRRISGAGCVRAPGGDAPVVWDGPAALVAVLVGYGGVLGSGDQLRGPGFLLLGWAGG